MTSPKAEPLVLEALAIRRKVLGPDHFETAYSLNDLGLIYWRMDDDTRAEEYFRQAVAVMEKAVGEQHFNTIYFRTNLANLLEKRHEYAEAESLIASKCSKPLEHCLEKNI